MAAMRNSMAVMDLPSFSNLPCEFFQGYRGGLLGREGCRTLESTRFLFYQRPALLGDTQFTDFPEMMSIDRDGDSHREKLRFTKKNP
jgi:hypothetical protein